MAQVTTIEMENGLVKRLVNPFMSNTPPIPHATIPAFKIPTRVAKIPLIRIPAGTLYFANNTGDTMAHFAGKEMKISHFLSFKSSVSLVSPRFEPEISFSPRFKLKVSFDGKFYRNDSEAIFVSNPYINFAVRAKSKWRHNYMYVTEELIRYNGLVPQYEIIGEFKNGEFIYLI